MAECSGDLVFRLQRIIARLAQIFGKLEGYWDVLYLLAKHSRWNKVHEKDKGSRAAFLRWPWLSNTGEL